MKMRDGTRVGMASATAAAALLFALACAGESDGSAAAPRAAGRRETDFRLCDVAVIGARMSAHVPNATARSVPSQWKLSRPPARRLLDRGCRAFDVDFSWDEGFMTISNVPWYDYNSTSETLSEFVSEIAAWSCAHPLHEPIFFIVRHSPGDPETYALGADGWAAVWDATRDAWARAPCRGGANATPPDAPDADDNGSDATADAADGRKAVRRPRDAGASADSRWFVTSRDVRGGSPSVAAAVSETGGAAWPTFADARGKMVVAFARELDGSGPESCISSNERVGAFVSDGAVAAATGSITPWTGFYAFGDGDALGSDAAEGARASGSKGAAAARPPQQQRPVRRGREYSRASSVASSRMIVSATPDRAFAVPGFSTSAISMASAADTDSDRAISIDEAAAFAAACGRRMPRRSVARILSKISRGDASPARPGQSASAPYGPRGYTYRTFAAFVDQELSWVAPNPPPTIEDAAASATRATAAGVNLILSDFPGIHSSFDALGGGYYLAFSDGAPFACRGSSDVCTVPPATELLEIPDAESRKRIDSRFP